MISNQISCYILLNACRMLLKSRASNTLDKILRGLKVTKRKICREESSSLQNLLNRKKKDQSVALKWIYSHKVNQESTLKTKV